MGVADAEEGGGGGDARGAWKTEVGVGGICCGRSGRGGLVRVLGDFDGLSGVPDAGGGVLGEAEFFLSPVKRAQDVLSAFAVGHARVIFFEWVC